jgi:ABC-2 type transport system ATP-binding protein
MSAVVTFTAVTKRFGSRDVLNGLSLSVGAGEVFALVGPNGAGKTTTLNLALGFAAPDGGRVEVCGEDVHRDPVKARQCLAYLPEQLALYPNLSGSRNLRYFTLLAGLDLKPADLRAVLNAAGLPDDAHAQSAGAYSKGMRQKVGIAIAMARNARILLLDEPTSGLDPAAAADLSRSIRAAAGRGVAVLMATHDLYRVRELADRVGVLNRGRIGDEIDPKQLDHVALERLYVSELAP